MTSRIRTTAVFLRPFKLESFEEVLPAREYEIEAELMDSVDWIEPRNWTATVLVHFKSIFWFVASGDRRMKSVAKQFLPTGASH